MLSCDNPPPVTVILDPGDDLVHTRAALAVHAPGAGRLTVHPTPGTDSVLTLAYDILAALGKPVPVPGYRQLDTAPAWTLVAAWILATHTSHLMLLRAHFLTPHRLKALLQLRHRTGCRLALVCHTRHVPAPVERVLAGVAHHVAEAAALLPAAEPPTATPPEPATRRPLANRWLNLPALTTLSAFDSATRPCQCTAPMAEDRDFFAPVLPALTEAEVALRLHRATAHPHLAAELATAVFTAASMTQLTTAHVRDLAPDASTLTLHDDGLRQGCMTHHVPTWARPLLLAAAFTWRLASGTGGALFTDPLGSTGLPGLTDFAENCKLRPPQPPRPKRRKGSRAPAKPPKTIWPFSPAHYALSWAMREPDLMQGCPHPPPHTRRTIDAYKKGWPPPHYGPRSRSY
ncbi:hypothetical protein OHA09_35980 [Streptomyces longwoodensis]|uniref:hypothetical protein n=1 Tax=Streptomyces longwoodensis TaxID=68231 RepID=UPI002E80BD60|nr:hypothetical protein [Streptomyces longwoodensis]WUC55766.1 hypothetical protein OHA09_00995 [Streptomyces longwoodensis]WUC62115.1 hypothetical protein OHA09_35980 [Streptomyces longwoodensis]